MPGRCEADDFEFPSEELGGAGGGFVAFAASAEEECFVEAWWGDAGEAFGEVDDGRTDHAAEEVIEVLGMDLDYVDDFWVAMAD